MLYMLTNICESTAADTNQRKIPNKVLDCYKFVSYLVDPIRTIFQEVVRIFVFVLRFISMLWKKSTICQPGNKLQIGLLGELKDE